MNAAPSLANTDAAAALAAQPTAWARAVDLVVIHCSATPSGQWLHGAPLTPGWVSPSKSIDNWHAERGFARGAAARERFNPELGSIGYHYVIDLDGAVYTGRHVDEAGAHVAGFNARSVGICLVGGAERDARYTVGQWRSLGRLVRELCLAVPMLPAMPLYPRAGNGVCGHRDLSPDLNNDGRVQSNEWLKTCPGFDVGAWLARGMEPTGEQIIEVRS